MSEITHSVICPESYSLSVRGTIVGYVKRLEDGFLADLLTGDSFEARTMKALKEWAAGLSFVGIEERADRKPLYLTVDQARQDAPLSHTKAAYLLRMIPKCWPDLKPAQWGITMVYLQKVEIAKWEWGQTARDWLAENRHHCPPLKRVDWDLYNDSRERDVRYLPGFE